jgi:hypothetical protein
VIFSNIISVFAIITWYISQVLITGKHGFGDGKGILGKCFCRLY